MDLDELVDHRTLLQDERKLVAGKRGPTRLGFAVLLKFYARAGRFPRGRAELDDDAVAFVARQVGVPASDLGFYEWAGSTIEYHRAQIRRHLGLRECTAEDAAKLTGRLAASVCQAERRPDRVREELLTQCRAEQIEPPSAGRCDRIIRSALLQAEQALTARVTARLGPDDSARLAALATAADDEADGGEPSALALIKSVPGNVSLESMLTEISKLDAARAAGLPDGLFSGIAPKVVTAWRARAAVEAPSHLRDHPRPLMLTLLAALVHERQREITDTLADLLISTVHRIGARAERRVTQELVSEFRKVAGKETLLFRLAEAAIARPDDTVRAVVYPVAGEKTLRDLVAEYKSSGPAYRRTVQTTLRGSYTGHYRRGLIRLLEVLEFRTGSSACQPVIEALALIRRHAAAGSLTYYPAGEYVPAHAGIAEDWKPLVYRTGQHGRQRVVRMVYEVVTFQALREHLRCKEIWITGADRWRNPDEDLPADFETRRAEHYASLRKPLDPAAFITSLREEMRAELDALHDALPRLDWLQIAERREGNIKLTPLDAAPEPRNLRQLKKEITARWGTVPLIDMLKEAVLAHRLPDRGHLRRRPRRPRPRRAGPAAAAGRLRLRHQHRDPRGRRRGTRPQRRRHPLRAPPVPVAGERPGHGGRDRQRHLRRPPPGHLGDGLHRGGVGLHPLRRVRPEHLHRMARPLRRTRRPDLLARRAQEHGHPLPAHRAARPPRSPR